MMSSVGVENASSIQRKKVETYNIPQKVASTVKDSMVWSSAEITQTSSSRSSTLAVQEALLEAFWIR